MSVTADKVKELRERTGAGMMECKRALVSTDGNIEKAIEEMRKSGLAKADKKSGRTAAEGVIVIVLNEAGNKAVLLEVNCETDFVGKDQNFVEFADAAGKAALQHNIKTIEALSALSLGTQTVDEVRKSLISKLGENIQLRRIVFMEGAGVIGSYLHGIRIGVLVNMKGGDAALAKDIAMHIAANKPLVVSPDQVSPALVEKEREIYAAQAKDSGKPAEIIEKMVNGRITKFLDEVSLLGQPFVKDPNRKVSDLLKEKQAEVVGFEYFVLGEGIEKEASNFVEEVMAQVRGGNEQK